MNNLLTDVAGIRVGNAEDRAAKTGVTTIVFDEPAVASCHVMGGAPGTRETDLLAPEQTVERIDAVVLAGGSAFGLDAAGGVVERLAADGRGFEVGSARVPIVPGAILFDLVNGGDKSGLTGGLFRQLGQTAYDNLDFVHGLGTVGAGTGATTNNLKGGLGAASSRLPNGVTVAGMVAANPIGQVTIGETAYFWAAAFERDNEFGGLGLPATPPPESAAVAHKLQQRIEQNTAIGIVATDATLTKAEVKRMAVMAHDGIARSMYPSHTPYDGDIIFAVATGRQPREEAPDMVEIGSAASVCCARAACRAIYEATAEPGDLLPTWRDKFG